MINILCRYYMKVLTRSWHLFYLASKNRNNEIINADLNPKMKQRIFTGKSLFTSGYFLYQGYTTQGWYYFILLGGTGSHRF